MKEKMTLSKPKGQWVNMKSPTKTILCCGDLVVIMCLRWISVNAYIDKHNSKQHHAPVISNTVETILIVKWKSNNMLRF